MIPSLPTFVAALVLAGSAPAAFAQDAAPTEGALTLAQTNRGSGAARVSLSPELPRWRWAWDGVHLELPGEKDEKGKTGSPRWFDARSGDAADFVPKEDGDAEAAAKAVSDLANRIAGDGERPPKKAKKIAEAILQRPEQTSNDGTARMVYVDEELWVHRDGSDPIVVARGADGEIRYDRLAPDGAVVTFVRENDLYMIDAATGESHAITSNGGPERFNGVLDWVYQEEIYGRGDFLGHFWSPTGRHTAFLSLDESPVHEFTVVDHIEDDHFRVDPEVTNYPKVGDPNPIVSVGIADVRAGKTHWVDLSSYDGQEILVVRVGWTPDGARCLVHVQDRIQTWMDLLAVDPATGVGEVLIRETSDAWTERPEPPLWLADGTFLWQSHRTGTNHLYRYRADGTLVGAVTSGPWNLTSIDHVDEPTEDALGAVWFQCTEGGDIDTNLYRVALDGSGFTRLTKDRGTHSVSFNGDRSMFIDRFSSLTVPGVVRLCDADGNIVRELARAERPAADIALGTWELHRVATRDGVELDAALLKPADFDPARKYAVWVSTYSGPAAPSVRNRWNTNAFFHYLAQNGVLVLQANVRTSTRRGHAATKALYRRVGLQEVDDMVDVVEWLTKNPWADAERVGITGYSFGGTMTANCLCRTDRFALGIAGGGVYDWRMYDTIYTERYMRTPSDNLEGYEATSVLGVAKDLRGHLHLHHGIMDDNVHVQNMFQMAHALMKAGKTNWSMMAYAQTRHGIRDAQLSWHARQMEWELIREHLLDGAGGS
ncbi:MAG: DPP IV N-terminal domain-containing protein [Planctomycetota bacterium]